MTEPGEWPGVWRTCHVAPPNEKVPVRPQEWQRVMLAGQPAGSEYLVAARLWPQAEWRVSERSRKPHGGLVDAALIAEYGRRRSR